MLRNFGAALLGYIVMAVLVLTFFAIMAGLVPDVFRTDGEQPGATLPLPWTLLTLAFGLVAAVVGGWVCRRVADGPKAVKALAGIVAILGIVSAFGGSDGYMWVGLGNAVVGGVGVLIGGQLTRSAPPPALA